MLVENDARDALIASAVATVNDAEMAHFTRQLFAHASGEDLARYGAADLLRLGAEAFARHAARTPGVAEVRLIQPGGSPDLDAITIVEILNDDMPFLVDSAMAAISELGLDIRLVAHPVLQVTRDAMGQRLGFAETGGHASRPRSPR